MTARTQISLDPELDSRAKKKADKLGISFSEYVRRLIRQDVADGMYGSDVSAIFGLGDSGRTDISRDKHRLIGKAIAAKTLKRGR